MFSAIHLLLFLMQTDKKARVGSSGVDNDLGRLIPVTLEKGETRSGISVASKTSPLAAISLQLYQLINQRFSDATISDNQLTSNNQLRCMGLITST